MKVNCISCGHTLDLRDAYDDYEGKVRCFICGAMLTIRTCDGQVKAVDLPSSPRLPVPRPASICRAAAPCRFRRALSP